MGKAQSRRSKELLPLLPSAMKLHFQRTVNGDNIHARQERVRGSIISKAFDHLSVGPSNRKLSWPGQAIESSYVLRVRRR
jgi:hypothetical protein